MYTSHILHPSASSSPDILGGGGVPKFYRVGIKTVEVEVADYILPTIHNAKLTEVQ